MNEESPSFFAELTRRKIIRASIVYLGVTFALLQAADIAFPRLDFPDWTITLVMVLSMIGFPIMLVGVWAFDYGDADDSSKEAHKMSPLRIVALIVVILLAAAVTNFYYTRLIATAIEEESAVAAPAVEEPTEAPADLEASIAVLPFVNMSDDPSNEYFSDGISEELLDALAKLDNLRVVARTSSFSFKGTNRDIREIASELNVSTVLEGSVRKAGNQVRITAQLINASDGYHLWSDTYDRELLDIFAVQDEIAQSIVDALHLPLGLEKSTALVAVGTQNSEAYTAYLKGLHFSQHIGAENFEKAAVHLNQAVALDPLFAAPHSVLAYIHGVSILWRPPEVVMPLAIQAFERALQLDPTQGLALITKGQYLTMSERNWVEGKEYFLRGLEDETEKTWASFLYATMHLMPMGAFAEARAVLEEAIALDPLDSRLRMAEGSLSLFEGSVMGAITGYEAALAIDPANAQAASGLCAAFVRVGDFSAAQVLISSWAGTRQQVHPWLLTCRGLLEQTQGDDDAALDTYLELAATARQVKGLAFLVGDIALAIGRIDDAMDWYERSVADGEVGILMIRSRLLGQPELLMHPRMQKILLSLKLDDASLRAMGYLPG